MTFLAQPRAYKPEELPAFLASKKWSGWRPQFVTLHNTAAPTLKQWLDPAHTAQQRIEGQRHYERDILHWHSGVHFFVAPDVIWNLCDVTQDGVHCSCFNHISFGVEMIGDYSAEAFDKGDGAKVRDNAVVLLAALHNRFGWHPDPLIHGVAGLHFHKMCKRDHHDCPGKNVDRADIVARVFAEMKRQAGKPAVP